MKDDNEYNISLITSRWYAEQEHGWNRFKYVCRKIWAIIRGKDFYNTDLILSKNEWQKFKQAINCIPCDNVK